MSKPDAKKPSQKESSFPFQDVDLVSFGFAQLPNSKDWVSYTLYTKNSEIVKVVLGNQDTKLMAMAGLLNSMKEYTK